MKPARAPPGDIGCRRPSRMSQRGSIPCPAPAQVHRRLWFGDHRCHVVQVAIGWLNLRPTARTHSSSTWTRLLSDLAVLTRAGPSEPGRPGDYVSSGEGNLARPHW